MYFVQYVVLCLNLEKFKRIHKMCWICKTTATQVFVFISGSWWWSNTGGYGLWSPVWSSPIWERCGVISEIRAITRQVFFSYNSVGLIMRNGQEREPTVKCGLWTTRRMKSVFLSQNCVFGRGEQKIWYSLLGESTQNPLIESPCITWRPSGPLICENSVDKFWFAGFTVLICLQVKLVQPCYLMLVWNGLFWDIQKEGMFLVRMMK